MPDAAAEIVYTGAGKPPSWGERAGRFVREKIIAPHTPEAHYDAIMKKYFWVTDRLEGPSLELAQRIRPAVELYAKAAGWSQTITELYLAGSAVAVTALLAGKGIKSVAGVFGEMARRQGSTMPSPSPEAIVPPLPEPPAAVVDLGSKPAHISEQRWAAMRKVSAAAAVAAPPIEKNPRAVPVVGDNGQVERAMLAAMKEAIQHRTLMQTVGREAGAFGDWLTQNLPSLPDEQRRHAQRAYAQILEGLLSENGSTPASQRDVPQAFVQAIEVTKPPAGGLSSEHIGPVVAALEQFSNLGKKLASQGNALRS